MLLKSQRLITTLLNNLNPNPTSAKPTDYEVNLSAMKGSGLPTEVRCFNRLARRFIKNHGDLTVL